MGRIFRTMAKVVMVRSGGPIEAAEK